MPGNAGVDFAQNLGQLADAQVGLGTQGQEAESVRFSCSAQGVNQPIHITICVYKHFIKHLSRAEKVLEAVLSLKTSSGRGARATSTSARNSVDPERRVKGAALPKSMRWIQGAAVGDWLIPAHCHSTWFYRAGWSAIGKWFSPSWLSFKTRQRVS